MICPNCNSENTRKLSVIYDEGSYSSHSTSKINGTSRSTTTSSSGRTSLAKKCSPPVKMNSLYIFIWIFLFFFIGQMIVFAIWEPSYKDIFQKVITAIGALIALMISGSNFKDNLVKYPKQLERWKNSWLCMKCGHKYEYRK